MVCSVVIVNKNGGEALFATIYSVLLQAQLSELIIVDNGTAPDVVSRLKQISISDPRLKVIAGHGDVGLVRGLQIGAKHAAGEFLLFLNSGYLLPPDAIKNLVSALGSEDSAMLAGAVVVGADGKSAYECRRQVVTPKSIFYEIVGIGKAKVKKAVVAANAENISKNKPFEVAAISSACMCIRAADYKKIGGFDDGFYPVEDDVDFCLRVEQINGRVFCVPAIRITKLPDPEFGESGAYKHWLKAKNNIRYLRKFFAGYTPLPSLLLLNFLLTVHGALNSIFAMFSHTRTVKLSIEQKKLVALADGLAELPKNGKLHKKIVLLTGATSPVGIFVIKRLIAAGAAVIALSRGDGVAYRHPNLLWLKDDLASGDFNLQGYCVDCVVHAAPLALLPPLVDLLKDAEAKRVIAFSSTSVFSNILSGDPMERDYANKLQAAEKLLIEKCEKANLQYTIFRPTISYGLGLCGGIGKIVKLIKKWGFVLVYPPAIGLRQPVHADDLAIAVEQAMDSEVTYGKSYNLSGKDTITYRQMLGHVFVVCGKKPRVISTTALPFALNIYGKIRGKKSINGEIARRMNDDFVFFHDDAKRDFSYSPRSFFSADINDI